ncbi:hypothetical protein J6590_011608 [Homalodisca vitripennis]|nr:hypothetical protein J6590_011608 [Homalodisca vitripennis]
MQIMQSMVLSVFNYCYPAYGNSITKKDAGRIQRLQNSAIRFIFSLNKFDHVSPSRKDANIIAMQDVCRMMTCCMVHKALTTGEPEYLSERLRGEDVSERSTRQRRLLHFPKVRLEFLALNNSSATTHVPGDTDLHIMDMLTRGWGGRRKVDNLSPSFVPLLPSDSGYLFQLFMALYTV